MLNVDPRVAQRPKSACDHRDNKMHEIYLARSDSQELRKTFVNVDDALQTRPFNPGTEFSYERRHCRSMADVRDLLNGLADDPHCAAVLGHPLNPRGSRNSQTFEDAATTLWWLDLDGGTGIRGGHSGHHRAMPAIPRWPRIRLCLFSIRRIERRPALSRHLRN